MAWYSGTATDYRDFLSKIEEFATSIGIQTITINNDGTGYTVGDTLTVSGGTSTTACTIEVAAVGGSGEITLAFVINAGAYSAAPGLTGAATTGGTGSGATFDLTTQAAGWQTLRNASQRFVIRVETFTAGTGYTVNDILTLDSSGDAGTTPVTEATFRVTSVGGSGEITAIAVETGGEYTANSSGSEFPLTGGTGTGASLDPFFDGVVGEDELIMEGSGSGSDQIFVGVRTFTISGIGARNWELSGFTGFDATLENENQPGRSPALYDDQSPISGGAYLLLRDVSFSYWVSINSNRISIVVRTGSNYHSAWMGFLDRFTTDAEYPYPLLIMGSCTEPERVATSADVGQGGWPDPIADADGDDHGPGMLRWIDGRWLPVRNGYKNSNALSSETFLTGASDPSINVWPGQAQFASVSLDDEDNWATGVAPEVGFEGIIIERTIGASPDKRMEPTPNTGGAIPALFPLTLHSNSLVSIIGQPQGLYWASMSQDGGSAATSEDTFTIGTRRFRAFQNVYRTEIYSFFVMEEA